MLRIYSAIFVVMALALAGFSVKAGAVIVEVPLEFSENATKSQTLAEAKQQAFCQAVLQESLELLPAPLDPARQALLEEFLQERAGNFVLSYKNVGSESPDEEPIFKLDMSIDRSGLKKMLTSLGLYSTILGSLPFTLETEAIPPDGILKINLLQALSGLRQEAGASPTASIRYSDGVWSGRLNSAGGESIAQAEDAETLWIKLWGPYFSRMEQKAALFEKTDLTISGWYSTDGVEAFQQILKSWDQAVDSVELQGMVLSTQGIQATWRISLKSKRLLQSRLKEYLSKRGLSYNLSESGSDVVVR